MNVQREARARAIRWQECAAVDAMVSRDALERGKLDAACHFQANAAKASADARAALFFLIDARADDLRTGYGQEA